MNGGIFERELCLLADAVSDAGIRLIVGGGYGLVLRQRFLREQQTRTLRPYPGVRSTQDIDLFFAVELLVDAERLERFREALHAIGYVPVESAQFYQFFRNISHAGGETRLKIDLLAAIPRLQAERAPPSGSAHDESVIEP